MPVPRPLVLLILGVLTTAIVHPPSVNGTPTSDQAVKAVADALASIQAGNISAFLSHFTEDAISIVGGTPALPWFGRFEGQDANLQGLAIYAQYFDITFNDPDLFYSSVTGRVVLSFVAKGTVVSTGAAFEEQCFDRFAINDDVKIYETVEQCNSLAEYEAVLSETKPVGGVCDPASSTPNQCFNAGGTRSVCCSGPCPSNPTSVPSCTQYPE